MAHLEQREFCEKVKRELPNFFRGKKVLDIGSLDINGSNKDLFVHCNYIGLDLDKGKNVDVVGVGHQYDAPDNYFDTIISTEVFEHDMYYDKTIANIIRMLKPGGLFLFTCASTGRNEHGTRRTSVWDAPLLGSVSEEWSDYYKNLVEDDIKALNGFTIFFPDGHFEYGSGGTDLYFYGVKGGEKYLVNTQLQYPKEHFDGDIFVIDCWPDNESKENDLLKLIKTLKVYNVPILLTGHYPIKPEIQKMVDYYIFDKNNPLLLYDEFEHFDVGSGRWTAIGDIRVDNYYSFHHDYAIWEAMRNAFNFCKYLGKTNIHFLEYDNIPDPIQYRQAFMENIRHNDVVLYEYCKGSMKDTHLGEYCATFIFSIKTDVALRLVDQIKSKDEYFRNKPKGWQLEKNFLEQLKKVTDNIYLCTYIDNNGGLNTQAVWNRDGMNRNGARIQIYLAVDDNDDLYLHTISGFHEKPATEDYLVEFEYQGFKKFITVKRGELLFHKLGKYQKGYSVKGYHQGVEMYSEFLGEDVEQFRKLNKLTNIKNTEIMHHPKLNVNFIDGPFVEILEDQKRRYDVKFINTLNNTVAYGLTMESNHWARCSTKYCKDWLVSIKGIDNNFNYEHRIDFKNRRVLISFESKALGDTLAWIPYVEKFRTTHDCEVICSTFHNKLFKDQYKFIKFVEPGSNVSNIYALYRLGIFLNNKKVDFDKHFTDPKQEPLMKVASDILGLDYVELKPMLPTFSTVKKKVVSIAIHGTAQCKYWNNPTGWQEVVDYLVKEGYEVKLLSNEQDGYMGNRNPRNITKVPPGTIENIIKILQESELFIGISSGLSWLSWASGTPTILISGFTDVYTEPMNGINRIINRDVCNSCWNNYTFDPSDWKWCPVHKGTDQQFECSKSITSERVIEEIKKITG